MVKFRYWKWKITTARRADSSKTYNDNMYARYNIIMWENRPDFYTANDLAHFSFLVRSFARRKTPSAAVVVRPQRISSVKMSVLRCNVVVLLR